MTLRTSRLVAAVAVCAALWAASPGLASAPTPYTFKAPHEPGIALGGDIGYHAVRWDGGLEVDVGTLGEGKASFAWGLGNDGTAVGYSCSTT
jgi:hypothetical protein